MLYLFNYSVIGRVLIWVTEWMKIKYTFICLFLLQPPLPTLIWHKKYHCNVSRMFFHYHLKLNASENVRCIHENWKEIVQTDCKFKFIWLKKTSRYVINPFTPFFKKAPYIYTHPLNFYTKFFIPPLNSFFKLPILP